MNRDNAALSTALKVFFVVLIALVGAQLGSQAAISDPVAQPATVSNGYFSDTSAEITEKKSKRDSAEDTATSAPTDTDHPKSKDAKDSQKRSLATPQAPAPAVNATAFLVADLASGKVFAKKSADRPRPIASITKLMTAVIASETQVANDTVTVSPQAAATYGRSGRLLAGDRITVGNLLAPLLLESSNDAAVALAEHTGKTQFINYMNRKATALGMSQTRFADASGLSSQNVSSPNDLLKLTRYIHQKKPFIFDLTKRSQVSTPDRSSEALDIYTANNPMVGRPDFLGGKNGYTDEARHTLLSLFSVPFPHGSRPVAIIVLGSDTHKQDTKNLLRWLKTGR
jgi:D-alanyl-D-alanine endopeptidase (penicillin-binding protein 7)